MSASHQDKEEQLKLLLSQVGMQVEWYGIRPLQMGQFGVTQKHTGAYQLGMIPFSGMSKISFADCADAMLAMLTSDQWRHQAPIVRY